MTLPIALRFNAVFSEMQAIHFVRTCATGSLMPVPLVAPNTGSTNRFLMKVKHTGGQAASATRPQSREPMGRSPRYSLSFQSHPQVSAIEESKNPRRVARATEMTIRRIGRRIVMLRLN